MNCPACNKNLASTLSVCPSCGTMVHDSVREELALKIFSPVAKTPKVEIKPIEAIEKPLPAAPVISSKPILPPVNKPMTSEIRVKQTVPTLVDFQPKKTTIPEWRLELQNTIRMRNERSSAASVAATAPRRASLVTNGAIAMKNELYGHAEPVLDSNSTLAKAMQRIEQSRQRFLVEEVQPAAVIAAIQPVGKPYPYTVHKPIDYSPVHNEISNEFVSNPVSPSRVGEFKAKFDTNKLPALPNIDINSGKPKVSITKVDLNIDDNDDFLEIHKTSSPDVVAYAQNEMVADQVLEVEEDEAEMDDRAPISLRFNAAIFDIIIGSFASLLLLSPFMLMNGKFFSIEGFFAFVATSSIVMFIYLTTSIGLLGKSFGMKLFSLEIIDIEENDYPTLHQAAVSSAVYLLSLGLGGLGFLTLFINSEKRAAHDLLSGTIIVKEYLS